VFVSNAAVLLQRGVPVPGLLGDVRASARRR
jgi:hypothetical protein